MPVSSVIFVLDGYQELTHIRKCLVFAKVVRPTVIPIDLADVLDVELARPMLSLLSELVFCNAAILILPLRHVMALHGNATKTRN